MPVPDFSSTSVDTSDPAAVSRAVTDYMQTDVDLNNLLQSDPGDWRFIYDVAIVDTNGKALLHTNASMVGKIVPPRPDFQQVVGRDFRQQIRLVFSPAAVYDVSYPLELNGAPFGTIRIGVQTVFLKERSRCPLDESCFTSRLLPCSCRCCSLPVFPILRLGPLKEISRNLDSVSSGEADALAEEKAGMMNTDWSA